MEKTLNKRDVKNLPHGLYRLHWKSGGYSLASVGSLYDGTRWFAPCNWTSGDKLACSGIASTHWWKVKTAELFLAVSNSEQNV